MSRGGHQDGRWYARAARHKRQNPVCLCCWSIGRTRAAEVADHVIPVTSEGGSLLAGELQSCCRGCHDSVKRKLEQLYSQGKCRVEDLKLDSPLAKKLRRQQRGEMRYGVNGRPLDDPDDGREPLPPLTDWVRIDGKEEPATTAPARTLPRHLAAALARQKAWKPA